MTELKEKKLNIQEVLAASFAVYRHKNYNYIKADSLSSEGSPSNSQLVKKIAMTGFDTLIRDDDTTIEIIQEDLENADQAIKFFNKFDLYALGDLNNFQQSIYGAYCDLENGKLNSHGLISYMPEFIKKETEKTSLLKLVKEYCTKNEKLGTITSQLSGTFRCLHKKAAQSTSSFDSNKPRFVYTGEFDGHLVRFFSTNDKLEAGSSYRITGNVSTFETIKFASYSKEFVQTRLNYVRVYNKVKYEPND